MDPNEGSNQIMSKTHYVNNADFYEALKVYGQAVKEAEESGEEKPIVSNYIGECILKIATHLSYKPNFINYSYRDDMILDGIENCIQYIDNFDVNKSKNPFAYFTQIIYYAFLRRIAKEKKQSYIKSKMIMDMPFESFELQEHDEDGTFHNAYLDFLQQHSDFTDPYEKKKAAKKAKQDNLETFMDDVNDNQDDIGLSEESGN
jgi:hypothetical protein